MILTPWHCWASITQVDVDKNHYDDLACKYFEFFPLWYIYIRHYRPDEHIYIVDCGSPIPIEFVLSWLKEPFEIIEGVHNFQLDMGVKIHIKRFTRRLDHFYGSSRTSLDYLRMCYTNGLDYRLIESDVLIGYNVFEEFVGKDFVTQMIHPDRGTIFQGSICFIARDVIAKAFKEGALNSYLRQDPNEMNFHEGEYYRLFCKGRTAELSRPQDYVHKCSARQLRQFIYRHKIDHPYVDAFMRALTAKINNQPLVADILSQALNQP